MDHAAHKECRGIVSVGAGLMYMYYSSYRVTQISFFQSSFASDSSRAATCLSTSGNLLPGQSVPKS
jgi:hypothetical protein